MIEPFEIEAGPDQLLVLYSTEDTGDVINILDVWKAVASDAAKRAAEGWHIATMTVTPLRQTGTAGNVLFQTGGQYATQIAVTVAYIR